MGNRVDHETPARLEERDRAIDFTKGVLVLLMVLYHWLNYFVDTELDLYRYLRFITPSFILVTGYLVARVYLGRYAVNKALVSRRLIERGLKIIGLFTFLNILVHISWGRGLQGVTAYVDSAYAIYVVGRATVAFDVLVPISYFLLVCPFLLALHNRSRYALPVTVGLVEGMLIAANALGAGNSILELVGFGILGMVVGTVDRSRMNRLLSRPFRVLCAYAVYLVAVARWNVVLPLQFVGTCLSVLLIYIAGTRLKDDGWVQRKVVALGQYSLFAYIVQILVLQLLLLQFGDPNATAVDMLMPLIATVLLTVVTVQATMFARRKSIVLDRLYRAVLA
jgi:peptidoglycan/LPS O-acetylase OafA/YrhL